MKDKIFARYRILIHRYGSYLATEVFRAERIEADRLVNIILVRYLKIKSLESKTYNINNSFVPRSKTNKLKIITLLTSMDNKLYHWNNDGNFIEYKLVGKNKVEKI
jgi:hypothetical protein